MFIGYNKGMIKGALFDIDDTLYSHKIHNTPALTMKALRKLKEQGIHIGINTSRSYVELHSVPKDLRDFFELEVCGTGSMAYCDDKKVHTALIDSAKADRLMECLIKEKIPYTLTDDKGEKTFCSYYNQERAAFWFTWSMEKPRFYDYQSGDAITIIEFHCKDEEQLKTIMNNYPQFNYSVWGCSAMANARGITKASGVDVFANYFGLANDEVIAFGDGNNDGEMLEAAGIGVAVKEAHINCARCADYICKKSIERGGIYDALVDLEVIKEDRLDLKAFFFDIDSTTFDHTLDDIRPSTYYALRKLKEKGCFIAIATSRSREEMSQLPSEFLEMMDALITLGGACIYYKNSIERHYLDDNVKKVIQYLDENDITYRYVCDQGSFLNRTDDYGKIFERLYHMIPPTKKYEGEKVQHMIYYPRFEDQPADVEQLMPKAEHVHLRTVIEIAPYRINKGQAIVSVAEHFGFGQENTCAFGDSMNDLQMLQMAKLGVCMGNGVPALFQEVDYVADDISEEGLYRALVHFNLIEPNKAFED